MNLSDVGDVEELSKSDADNAASSTFPVFLCA